MIYFYSSKIAGITKYNKYTSNDDYVKIFLDTLYKNKDELKLSDEKMLKDKIYLKEDEYINHKLLKNVNENTKKEINNMVNSNVNNNNELLNKTEKLALIIDNDNKEKKKEINNIIYYNVENNDDLLKKKEKLLSIIDNANETEKKEIINIINSNVTNNDELIKKKEKLSFAIEKVKSITETVKNKLNSKLNCNYGTNNENLAIKLYEEETNNKVYDNNDKLYSKRYTTYAICGKTDGFVKIDNKKYIFETKNRKNRLFNKIPIYEKIQLLVYTKICNINNIIFTERLNDKINITILDDYKDENLWDNVLLKLKDYSDLIYKLQEEKKIRLSFIKLNDNDKFEFLQNYLDWL